MPNQEQYKCPPMSFKPRRSMSLPGTEILLKKILRCQTLRIRRSWKQNKMSLSSFYSARGPVDQPMLLSDASMLPT